MEDLLPPLAADPASRLEALQRGCGIVERSDLEVLAVRGEDRVRFLQGYVTCDVTTAVDSRVIRGFVTGIKGHVLADFELLATADALLLIVPAGRGEAVRDHLTKYVLADRVEIRDEPLVQLASAGPDAPSIAASLGLDMPADAASWVGGDGVRAWRELGGVSGFRLLGPESDLRSLAARAVELGATAVDLAAWDVLRVESGQLRWGADFADGSFPQETGRTDAVDFEKGCYLGQEVVARIHYRGGVQKAPRGLRLTSDESPGELRGAELAFDGRAVGTLGSAVSSPRFGAIGLAIVHLRGAEPGTILEIGESRGTATVADLPFDRASSSSHR